MQKLAAAVVVCAALAAPSLARAGDVAMRVQEIPLGSRTIAAATAPMHFNMLAAHWCGPGTLLYRVHRLHGRWSSWRIADADVAPDGGTGRWHDGNLDWTGASDAIRFRVRGRITRLRAYELWSRVTGGPPRRLSEAGSPPIVTRAEWGANEKIVRAKPVIAPVLKLAVVHHTAGTNSYTPSQAAAIVRGIELYHVQGNGWNDIGYNFLVDRYGVVYEGRGGGIDRNVVGAHSQGFNTATVGISLIGNFSHVGPPPAQRNALVSLLAWRLDVAHVDPMSRVVYTSGGNAKFEAGTLVTLRAVSGHRDTGPSECPGKVAYGVLPSIARRVAQTGLPKIYAPTVAGRLGGAIRFQARLSAPQAWAVTVANAAGRVVARGAGTGVLIDWTWRSAGRTGSYTWTIATADALAATGTIGKGHPAPPPAESLTGLAAAPAVITPAPDGSEGITTIEFTLGVAAQVTSQVRDVAGVPLATVLDEPRPAGVNTFAWDASGYPDGRYTLVVTAKPPGATPVTKSLSLVVDRTLFGLAVTPAVFSPNGDGISDTTTVSFTLTQSVVVRVDVVQQGTVLATPFTGVPAVGPVSVTWDGTGSDGSRLPDGSYALVVTVSDALGDVQLTLPVTILTQ